jgi:pyruvate/2-oxoglutarate dehydrogenase complex dihydrolipoamide dehydrogenase (E3) component
MASALTPDLCVIGAGSAGLSVAAGASQMGARVVLVEKGRMGGDCLNYGCVPSKSLLAAAHAASAVRGAARFGVRAGEPVVDFAKVHGHVHGVIAAIAPNDSVERFEGLGVTVLRDAARFTGPAEVRAGDATVRARRFVIATGSAPMVPPVPGLDAVPYLTNETVFDLTACPEHLLVLGGGPIGVELAQAFRGLGARVTVVEMARALGRDDPDCVRVALDALRAAGVAIHEQTRVAAAEAASGGVALTVESNGQQRRLEGSHLLVAAGRKANTDGLGLEAAGIAFDRRGIQVDSGLRTTNRKAFAIGDVAGPYQFTHMAAYQAGIVIRRALFRLPAKVDYRAVPWVTYTDPEVAQVGLLESEARTKHGEVRVVTWPLADNDRAQAEARTDGMVKVVTTRSGRVLGASIVGAHAGELVLPWSLAIARRLKIGALASVIAPYPTFSEASKRAAGEWFTPTLFSRRTRALVRLLLKLG